MNIILKIQRLIFTISQLLFIILTLTLNVFAIDDQKPNRQRSTVDERRCLNTLKNLSVAIGASDQSPEEAFEAVLVSPVELVKQIGFYPKDPGRAREVLNSYWEHASFQEFLRLQKMLKQYQGYYISRIKRKVRLPGESNSHWDAVDFIRSQLSELLLRKPGRTEEDVRWAARLLNGTIKVPEWYPPYEALIKDTNELRLFREEYQNFKPDTSNAGLNRFMKRLSQIYASPTRPRPVFSGSAAIAHRCLGGLEDSVARAGDVSDAIDLEVIRAPSGGSADIQVDSGGIFGADQLTFDSISPYRLFFVLQRDKDPGALRKAELQRFYPSVHLPPILTLTDLKAQNERMPAGNYESWGQRQLELLLLEGLNLGMVTLEGSGEH